MLRSLIRVAAILCFWFSTSAIAFVDPPTFDPVAPNSAQPITVQVRNGLCHGFLAPGPGIPPMRIERSPGIVDVIAPGLITFDPFCNGPPVTNTFDIGPLPAGEYEVRIWIIDLVTGFEETTQVASASLTVTQGPVTRPIPAFGSLAVVVLVLSICLVAWRLLGANRRSILALAALLGSASVSAQSTEKIVLVLLSASPGAPTPQMMAEPVEYSAGYLGQLSPGFTAENPTRAYYLLPRRASGHFANWIAANPNEARSKLERYIIVSYPLAANLQNALAALAGDANVLYAFVPEEINYTTAASESSRSPLPHIGAKSIAGGPGQAWRSDIGFDRAWSLAGGWALVGTMDNGLLPTHPDLISFDGAGSYQGGNFLPDYSADVGRSTVNVLNIEPNVDEMQPVAATNAACDPDADGFMTPAFAGHGTHVAGLIAANASNGDPTLGACKRCGISAFRVTQDVCILQTGIVRGTPTIPGIAAALTLMVDLGIQVVNQSFGIFTTAVDRCTTVPANDAWCLAITDARDRGILLVGASGNDRRAINFPSENANVVAVGGLEPDLTFWDDRLDMPPNLLVGNCPDAVIAQLPAQGRECGSNFTTAGAGERRQEVTMPARDIYSTIYPAADWNPFLECGDGFGDASATDGRGACTGTSMSAPIYTGLAGILRSINPLVMPGDPENVVDAIGIRDAVVGSATIPGGGAWSAQYGYGIPDAEGAARTMLGTVAGATVRNRLTPLFALYSAASTDLAYVTVPKAAISLVISNVSGYTSQGSAVAGYPAFPESATAVPQPPAPRADTFVLTTEFKTQTQHPNTLPLYWMDRTRNFPVGCTTGAGCNTANRDFLLLTTTAEIEAAKAEGFTFRGLQGYIYDRCTPEPTCIPAGAEKLYRKCELAEDDCAIFLESSRVFHEGEGYTAAYPVGSNMHIGYAYPNVDTDSDGLIDGFERLIRTRPDLADSDGDGTSDGTEFPLAGISMSDPCVGPNVQCDLSLLFANGFE
jgi:subtilisin family serine protease